MKRGFTVIELMIVVAIIAIFAAILAAILAPVLVQWQCEHDGRTDCKTKSQPINPYPYKLVCIHGFVFIERGPSANGNYALTQFIAEDGRPERCPSQAVEQ